MHPTLSSLCLTRRGAVRGATSITLILAAVAIEPKGANAAPGVGESGDSIAQVGDLAQLALRDGRVAERPRVLGARVYLGSGRGDLTLILTCDSEAYTILDQAVAKTGAGVEYFRIRRTRATDGGVELSVVIPGRLRSARTVYVTMGLISPTAATGLHDRLPLTTTARLGAGPAEVWGLTRSAADVPAMWNAGLGVGSIEIRGVDPQSWLAPALITVTATGTAPIPAGTQIRVTADSRIASPDGFRIVGENTSLDQRRIGSGTGVTYVVALPRSIPVGEYVGIAATWTPAPRAEGVRDPQPVSVDVTTGRTKSASQRTAASSLIIGQGSGGKLQ